MKSQIATDKNGNETVEIRLTDANKHQVSLRIVIDDENTNDLVYAGKIWQSLGGAIVIKRDNGSLLRITRDAAGRY